jgi:2-methylcitrate dehydratase PrpD
MIRSIVLGSEVAIRFGRAINTDPAYDYETMGDNPLAFRRGWWTPALLTAVGAAAASGVLLRLPAAAMNAALGLGLASAPTVPTDLVVEGASGRGLPMAVATRAGMTAADLAERGVAGLEDAGRSWARLIGPTYDVSQLTAGLPVEHEFHYLLYKPFAAVGPVFAPIEAALAISEDEDVAPSDIEAVAVHCYGRTKTFYRGEPPSSAEAARADLAYCVAHALVRHDRGAFLEDAFLPQAYEDVTIREIASKVIPTFTAAYEAEYPLHSAKCRVVVTLRDGTMREAERDREVLPEYHNPSRSESEGKFLRAATGCISAERAARFVAMVWNVEEIDDVRKLFLTLAD